MMHDAFDDEFWGVLPPTVRFHETVRDAVLSHSNGAVPAVSRDRYALCISHGYRKISLSW